MGNPNGDPDENRPRQLPDGTFYVTDVRLKRFARDYLKLRGDDILVDLDRGERSGVPDRRPFRLPGIEEPAKVRGG